MDDELSVGHLLLHEYKKLKDEQLARIGTRDNLIYVNLASLAAVTAASLQAEVPAFLLLIPPVCLVLGWTYLANDEKISAIGRHIRTVLAPQLETFLRTDVRLLTWEIQHRADRRRRLRKIVQLVIDQVTFCAPAMVAVVAYVAGGGGPVPLILTAGVELAAVLGLGWLIFSNADMSREAPVHPPAPIDDQANRMTDERDNGRAE